MDDCLRITIPKLGEYVYATLMSDGLQADLWGSLPALDDDPVPDTWLLAAWSSEISVSEGTFWFHRHYTFFLAREFRAIAEWCDSPSSFY